MPEIVQELPSGELRDENGTRLDVPPEWTPEHLLLAALGRCSLASLRHHADRAGLAVTHVSGSTHALLPRRRSVPATSCGSGQNCGSVPDGCGGSVSCGSCGSGQTCGGGGTPNVCGTGSCMPTTSGLYLL